MVKVNIFSRSIKLVTSFDLVRTLRYTYPSGTHSTLLRHFCVHCFSFSHVFVMNIASNIVVLVRILSSKFLAHKKNNYIMCTPLEGSLKCDVSTAIVFLVILFLPFQLFNEGYLFISTKFC